MADNVTTTAEDDKILAWFAQKHSDHYKTDTYYLASSQSGEYYLHQYHEQDKVSYPAYTGDGKELLTFTNNTLLNRNQWKVNTQYGVYMKYLDSDKVEGTIWNKGRWQRRMLFNLDGKLVFEEDHPLGADISEG